MAIFKHDGSYGGNSFSIETGDAEFDSEMGDQLEVNPKELAKAINAENVSDQLFARILTARREKFDTLQATE